MRFKFGDKLLHPLHCDRVIVRRVGDEFYLGFGMDSPDPNGGPSEEAEIHVYMHVPRRLMKAMLDVFAVAVQAHEATWGEIKAQPEAPVVVPQDVTVNSSGSKGN